MFKKFFCKKRKSKKSKNSETDKIGLQFLTIDDYYGFINDRKYKEEINKEVDKKRKDFKTQSEIEHVSYECNNEMKVLLKELINFYNNDICFGAATFKVLNNFNDYKGCKTRILAHYADNIVVKMISVWDYLFQILSAYIGTDLLANYKTRDKIVDVKSKKMKIVEDGKSIRFEFENYPNDIQNDLKNKLKKENKVLHVDKKNKIIKKAIKVKGLSLTNRIENILKLYKNQALQELKNNVRNDIIHVRSLGFKASIACVDIFLSQGVIFNQKSWYDFNKISKLLDENISYLQESIQTLCEIIYFDDYPNKIENASKNYFAYKLQCNKCNNKKYFTIEVYDKLNDSNVQILCDECNIQMEMLEQVKINEKDYYKLQLHNIVEHIDIDIDIVKFLN